MRICTHEVPQIWVCEACLLSNDKLSPKSGSTSDTCNDSQFQVHSKKLKSVEAGKVKFLTAEEAIRLSSGSQKMGSPQRTNFRLKCGLLNAAVPRSRKTPIPSKIATQVFSCLPETINPSVISSQLLNFSPQGGAQINSMINDQTAKMSKQSKGENAFNIIFSTIFFLSIGSDLKMKEFNLPCLSQVRSRELMLSSFVLKCHRHTCQQYPVLRLCPHFVLDELSVFT